MMSEMSAPRGPARARRASYLAPRIRAPPGRMRARGTRQPRIRSARTKQAAARPRVARSGPEPRRDERLPRRCRDMALVGSMPAKRPCSPPTMTCSPPTTVVQAPQAGGVVDTKRKRMYASVNEVREVPADGQLLLRSTLLEPVDIIRTSTMCMAI